MKWMEKINQMCKNVPMGDRTCKPLSLLPPPPSLCSLLPPLLPHFAPSSPPFTSLLCFIPSSSPPSPLLLSSPLSSSPDLHWCSPLAHPPTTPGGVSGFLLPSMWGKPNLRENGSQHFPIFPYLFPFLALLNIWCHIDLPTMYLTLFPSPPLPSPLSFPLPSDEFHVQIHPTAHSDRLRLQGQYVLKVTTNEIRLFTASGTLSTLFWSPLMHVQKAHCCVLPTVSNGLGVQQYGGLYGSSDSTTHSLLIISTERLVGEGRRGRGGRREREERRRGEVGRRKVKRRKGRERRRKEGRGKMKEGGRRGCGVDSVSCDASLCSPLPYSLLSSERLLWKVGDLSSPLRVRLTSLPSSTTAERRFSPKDLQPRPLLKQVRYDTNLHYK